MAEWITKKLNYRRCKIYKDTLFGKTIKNGYILDSPLIYKYKDNIYFILDTNYVWDGPSYPKFIQWIVGKKSTEALLASSAMHDSMYQLPVHNNSYERVRYRTLKIKRGAKMYKRMISKWPNSEDKPNLLQRNIQFLGLIIFQNFYHIKVKSIHH